MDLQPELPLPPPPLRADQPYVPRMSTSSSIARGWPILNGSRASRSSRPTPEGRGVHRRVDSVPGELPEASLTSEDERIHAHSLTM
jgi:hypothetical protein